jgi:transposase
MGKRGPLSQWGVLAKTDGTDAQNLANFGKNIQSCLFVAKSEEKKRLYSLLTRRRQLAEMLTAEKNR